MSAKGAEEIKCSWAITHGLTVSILPNAGANYALDGDEGVFRSALGRNGADVSMSAFPWTIPSRAWRVVTGQARGMFVHLSE
jgi:hypothetical protein